jgi:hypothetical protein
VTGCDPDPLSHPHWIWCQELRPPSHVAPNGPCSAPAAVLLGRGRRGASPGPSSSARTRWAADKHAA